MVTSNYALKIIAAAGKLFHQNGYTATGINEIIETADIAKATLYSHFKSKENLCVAFLEHRHREFIASLQNYIKKESLANHSYWLFLTI